MDNKLRVKIMDNYMDIEVLDIVEIEELKKKYIIYTLQEQENDDIFISILNEDEETYELTTIDDIEELKKVEEFLIDSIEDDG